MAERNRNEKDSVETWKRPNEQWIKINSDGLYEEKTRKVGFGVIARNKGAVAIKGKNKGLDTDSVLQAEATALMGELSKLLKRTDIEKLVKKITVFRFSLVNIKANGATDWLTNQARKGLSIPEWRMPLPIALVGLLDKDGLLAPHQE
ncbi:hypothetical protein DITRI_Ditri06bG0179900 [Diplodiscus trichospermus]